MGRNSSDSSQFFDCNSSGGVTPWPNCARRHRTEATVAMERNSSRRQRWTPPHARHAVGDAAASPAVKATSTTETSTTCATTTCHARRSVAQSESFALHDRTTRPDRQYCVCDARADSASDHGRRCRAHEHRVARQDRIWHAGLGRVADMVESVLAARSSATSPTRWRSSIRPEEAPGRVDGCPCDRADALRRRVFE